MKLFSFALCDLIPEWVVTPCMAFQAPVSNRTGLFIFTIMAGAIHRKKKSGNFITIDTHCLRNKNLKWDAKGLHSYLMQLPEDWKVNIEDLKTRGLDKREATMSPMNALISEGYVFRERVLDESCRFAGYDYHLFERPEHLHEFLTVNGKTVNGKTVNGKTVNGKTVNGKPATTKVLNSLLENSKNEESEDDEKKIASPPPAPALPLEIENELDDYINRVEAKKNNPPKVPAKGSRNHPAAEFTTGQREQPGRIIVTAHNPTTPEGLKVITVEALPTFYQPTNPEAAAKLMASMGKTPMAETADDAGALIATWCAENAETVKGWYSRAKRAHSSDDLERLTIKFCSCYSNHAESGKRTRFMGDPVLFFRNSFGGWLVDQRNFDKSPSAVGATRYGTQPQDEVYKPQNKPGTHQPNFVP